ncbi:hypothetical protein BB560_001678 [Smittium megazygosporum]|uniref:Uncharacterized protein n=1 Tax=Smittium megazygosporum TaxID=133381 RepID=A0A2T9ZGX8_9FUNG|nr:hypothetical protein BB560_001678 [Smittium megazygosporum]
MSDRRQKNKSLEPLLKNLKSSNKRTSYIALRNFFNNEGNVPDNITDVKERKEYYNEIKNLIFNLDFAISQPQIFEYCVDSFTGWVLNGLVNYQDGINLFQKFFEGKSFPGNSEEHQQFDRHSRQILTNLLKKMNQIWIKRVEIEMFSDSAKLNISLAEDKKQSATNQTRNKGSLVNQNDILQNVQTVLESNPLIEIGTKCHDCWPLIFEVTEGGFFELTSENFTEFETFQQKVEDQYKVQLTMFDLFKAVYVAYIRNPEVPLHRRFSAITSLLNVFDHYQKQIENEKDFMYSKFCISNLLQIHGYMIEWSGEFFKNYYFDQSNSNVVESEIKSMSRIDALQMSRKNLFDECQHEWYVLLSEKNKMLFNTLQLWVKNNAVYPVNEDLRTKLGLSYVLIISALTKEGAAEYQMALFKILEMLDEFHLDKGASANLMPICWYSFVKIAMGTLNPEVQRKSLEFVVKIESLEASFSVHKAEETLPLVNQFFSFDVVSELSSELSNQILKYLDFAILARSEDPSSICDGFVSSVYPDLPEFIFASLFLLDRTRTETKAKALDSAFVNLLYKLRYILMNNLSDTFPYICASVRLTKLLSKSKYRSAIFLEFLPTLASSQDAVTTMELVRIAEGLIHEQNPRINRPSLDLSVSREILAVRYLGRITVSNPKAWPDFLSLILNKFGSGFSDQADQVSFKHKQLDIAIVSALYEMLCSDGELYAGKILALLYQKLERIIDKGLEPKSWKFISLLFKLTSKCISEGGVDAREVWIALGLSNKISELKTEFMKPSNLKEDMNSHFIALLDILGFFKILPMNTTTYGDGSSPASGFFKEIVEDYLIPLSIDLLLALENVEYGGLACTVICYSLESLCSYSSELWEEDVTQRISAKRLINLLYSLKLISSSEEETHALQGKISKFIALLVDFEVRSMGRSVLKGTNIRKLTSNNSENCHKDLEKTFVGLENQNKPKGMQLDRSQLKSSTLLDNRVVKLVQKLASSYKNHLFYSNLDKSALALVYLSAESTNNKDFQQDDSSFVENSLLSAIDDILILPRNFFVPELVLNIFSHFFQQRNSIQVAETIYELLINKIRSPDALPHSRSNSILALGGLVRYTKRYNPSLASAFSEQSFRMIQNDFGINMVPLNGQIQNGYWACFVNRTLPINQYFDDLTLAALISSSSEWSISLPGDLYKNLCVFDFMVERMAYSFNGDLLIHNKASFQASISGIISLYEFLGSNYSFQGEPRISELLGRLENQINSTEIFGFYPFRYSNTTNYKYFDLLLFEQEFEKLDSFTVLYNILQITTVKVKLEMAKGQAEKINDNLKSAHHLLKKALTSPIHPSSSKLVEYFSSCSYICISLLLRFCSQDNKTFYTCTEMHELVEFIFEILQFLPKKIVNEKQIALFSVLKCILLLPLSGVLVSFKSFCLNQVNSHVSSENDSNLKDVISYLEKQTNDLDKYLKAVLDGDIGNLNVLFSQRAEVLQASAISMAVLSNLVSYNSIIIGPSHPFAGYLSIYEVTSTECSIFQVLDKFLGIDSLSLSNSKNTVNENDYGLARILSWVLSNSIIYQNGANVFEKEKLATGDDLERNSDNYLNKNIDHRMPIETESSSLINFGKEDPVDLKRLPIGSMCRTIWDLISDPRNGEGLNQVPKNQFLLWSSLLHMKWPFPVVDVSEKVLYYFEHKRDTTFDLVVTVLLSKWSEYMYSAAKTLMVSIYKYTKENINNFGNNHDESKALLGMNLLGRYGFGKILKLGGLDGMYEFSLENPSSTSLNKTTVSESTFLSQYSDYIREVSLLGLIDTNRVFFSYDKQTNVFSQGEFKFALYPLIANGTRTLNKKTALTPEQMSANRMYRQISAVSIPSSAIKGLYYKLVHMLTTVKMSENCFDFIGQVLNTVRSHFLKISSEDNKKIPEANKSQNLEAESSKDLEKEKETLQKSLDLLKEELGVSSLEFFKSLYLLKSKQYLNKGAVGKCANSANSVDTNLNLMYLFVCACNPNYKSLETFPKTIRNHLDLLIHAGGHISNLNFEMDFYSRVVELMLNGFVYIESFGFSCKELSCSRVDLNKGFGLLSAESVNFSDRIQALDRRVINSINALISEDVDRFLKDTDKMEYFRDYFSTVSLSVRIRAQVMCKTIPFGFLPNSQTKKVFSGNDKAVQLGTQVSLPHLIKILNFIMKAFDIVLLLANKIARQIEDNKLELASQNMANTWDDLNRHDSVLARRLLFDYVGLLVTDLIGILSLEYFSVYESFGKSIASFLVDGSNGTRISKWLESVSDKNQSVEDLESKYISIGRNYSLELKKFCMKEADTGVRYVLNYILPLVLVHFKLVCNVFKKTNMSEYILAGKITGIENFDRLTNLISDRVETILKLLLVSSAQQCDFKMKVSDEMANECETGDIDLVEANLIRAFKDLLYALYTNGIIDSSKFAGVF